MTKSPLPPESHTTVLHPPASPSHTRTTKPRIKLMIVDDSRVARSFLRKCILQQNDIELVAIASNGQSALDALEAHKPEIILLDVEMPVMDGLSAIPLIFEKCPETRIIMVSTKVGTGKQHTLQALRLGAHEVVLKPSSFTSEPERMVEELLHKIRTLASAPLPTPSLPQRPPPKHTTNIQVLAIGTSTGGPQALEEFFKVLPSPILIPILVVQHMPTLFLSMLASRLTKETGWKCRLASDGEQLSPNTVYIAPGDHHLQVSRKTGRPCVQLQDTPPEHFCRPAVDPLFRSVAQVYGTSVLGVVLTGMGEDGAAGAREIAKSGGRVIAQDEATSVIWGMPRAAVETGVVEAVLPLKRLAGYAGEICTAGLK